jgi:exosortase E/protease (VPEID-CTERM system)
MPRHLLGRLYLLAAILAVDCFFLAVVPHSQPLLGFLAPLGIVSFAVFLGLGHSALKADRGEIPFSGRLFAAHLFCVAAIFACNLAALHGFSPLLSRPAQFALSALLLLGIVLLALACAPLRIWIGMIRETSPLWFLACLAGVLAWAVRHPFQLLWSSSAGARGHILQIAVFDSVHALLRLILPDVIADPAAWIIGTPRFSVIIAEQCSGMEGLGLVLVFTAIWLWYFRKENRFPQALLLIPCALVSIWVLNIVRICAIILIGDAGAPDVAMVGFHSQAGWIAFTAVALAFSMATRKLSWVRKISAGADNGSTAGAIHAGVALPDEVAVQSSESPATAAYLVPFLAILAASFVSKSVSGYFEWLYPLRFIAAAVALWYYRAEYKKLDWRFGWIAPATGAAIFFVWIAPAWWTHEHSASPLGPALAALSPPLRAAWIAFRVAAAVITVPIAEELAFRGFLLRRLVSRNFDEVPFSRLTILSVSVSSLAFGLMHGSHWFVGILAGLAYAAVLKWRGRIGDAIVAHATSNLLLAAWVLLRGDWAQW